MTQEFNDPRIKAFFPHGHFFGHYDSRGGATLVVGGILEALATYSECFYPEDEEREQARQNAVQEYLGSFPVYFFDQSPEGQIELDADYEGLFQVGVILKDPFAIEKVKEELEKIKAADKEACEKWGGEPDEPKLEGFPEWGNSGVVFWVKENGPPEFEGHFIAPISLGEDACGVVFYKAGETV